MLIEIWSCQEKFLRRELSRTLKKFHYQKVVWMFSMIDCNFKWKTMCEFDVQSYLRKFECHHLRIKKKKQIQFKFKNAKRFEKFENRKRWKFKKCKFLKGVTIWKKWKSVKKKSSFISRLISMLSNQQNSLIFSITLRKSW